MFGLFKKKEPEFLIIDKVWMTETAKWNFCLQLLQKNPQLQLVAWFDKSLHSLNEYLAKNQLQQKAVLYKQLNNSQHNEIVFIEHHPLAEKEIIFFKQFNLSKAIVLSSLDEPFFKQFGSENILRILEKIGMQPNEQIEHSLITTSIKRAQDKIATQILLDQSANSQEEWLIKNIK